MQVHGAVVVAVVGFSLVVATGKTFGEKNGYDVIAAVLHLSNCSRMASAPAPHPSLTVGKN